MEKLKFDYLNILNTDLKGLNLTRITDPEEFYFKQLIDSIEPLTKSKLFPQIIDQKKIVIDVGFGGGFPILPLAKTKPEVQFLGFESKRKKADAVNLIAEKIGLTNVECFHHRLEEVLIDVDAVITFKAVADISELLPLINVGTKEVYACFYKGPQLNEKENFDSQLHHWNLLEDVTFPVPMTDGRRLLIFRNVPRGTNKAKKTEKLVAKLSELL